jgi:hypothetical protein
MGEYLFIPIFLYLLALFLKKKKKNCLDRRIGGLRNNPYHVGASEARGA